MWYLSMLLGSTPERWTPDTSDKHFPDPTPVSGCSGRARHCSLSLSIHLGIKSGPNILNAHPICRGWPFIYFCREIPERCHATKPCSYITLILEVSLFARLLDSFVSTLAHQVKKERVRTSRVQLAKCFFYPSRRRISFEESRVARDFDLDVSWFTVKPSMEWV